MRADDTVTEARRSYTAALAERSRLVQIAERTSGRRARRAWAEVADADRAVDFVRGDVERAVRAANPGADEHSIQTATSTA